jgi:hypothetical protein
MVAENQRQVARLRLVIPGRARPAASRSISSRSAATPYGNPWYFIDPTGHLYAWDGTPNQASGTLRAALDALYWAQPQRFKLDLESHRLLRWPPLSQVAYEHATHCLVARGTSPQRRLSDELIAELDLIADVGVLAHHPHLLATFLAFGFKPLASSWLRQTLAPRDDDCPGVPVSGGSGRGVAGTLEPGPRRARGTL